jgi:hypothetical protein
MPGRSSYSSHKSSRSSYKYSSPKSPVSPPPTSYVAPSPSVVHHNHQVEKPGFFSNMWSGFGLGAGQSIAMNMFRSDPKVTHVHENTSSITPSNLEANLPKEFVQCMKDNNNDKDLCKQFLE